MPGKALSGLLVTACAFFTGMIGHYLFEKQWHVLACGAAGTALGLFIVMLMRQWLRCDAQKIVGGAIGAGAGALLGTIANWSLFQTVERPEIGGAAAAMIMVIFTLVGLQLGSSKAKEFKKVEESTEARRRVIGILDTSVIIDGRIADVCETGFIGGDLIIPEFVLKELQAIADSPEGTRRSRGRRGLDILNKIQKQSYVSIIINDTDYPSVKEVDQKLIAMARETGYAILTNDFNLNKVAEVHSIRVLNVNQLANALKPVVLPGETMKVHILKEGKETGQGVAYLDDGTMVVVDHGRKYLGKSVEVTVSSVLQTTAGRMIFAVTKS
jgi:uncharacterized protein YacL